MNTAPSEPAENHAPDPQTLSLHPTTAAAIAARAELESLSYSEALRRLVSDGIRHSATLDE